MEDRPLKNVHVFIGGKEKQREERGEPGEGRGAGRVGDKGRGGRREKEEREKIYNRKYQETCFKQRTQPIVSGEGDQLKERKS